MGDFNAHVLAQILESDHGTIKRRLAIANALDTPPALLHELEKSSMYQFFFEVLQVWKSRLGTNATTTALANVLRQQKLNHIADKIGNVSSPPYSPANPVLPSRYFVGRQQELEKLKTILNLESDDISGVAVLVAGLGGMGKSEFCRQFIKEVCKDADAVSSLWFSGSTLGNLYQSMKEYVSFVGNSTVDKIGRPLPFSLIVKLVMGKIRDSKRWIIVIDNVDYPDKKYKAKLHRTITQLINVNAFVIVTSRNKDAIMSDFEFLHLQELSQTEAKQLVCKRLNLENDGSVECHAQVIKLCQAVQCFPLVLQQATAYIRKMQREEDEAYGIPQFLHAFESEEGCPALHINLSKYETTVYKILIMAMKKFQTTKSTLVDHLMSQLVCSRVEKHHGSKSLFLIMSLVLPDGIATDFLERLCLPFNFQAFKNCLSELHKFSLVRVNSRSVSIHRVVQKVVREILREEMPKMLYKLLSMSKAHLPRLQKLQILHVVQVWNHALKNEKVTLNNVELPILIFDKMCDLSFNMELIEFSSHSFQTLENIGNVSFGMEFRVVIAQEINGDIFGCLTKYRELYYKGEKILGAANSEVIAVAERFIVVLRMLKELSKSVSFLTHMLDAQEEEYGTQHQQTIKTKRHLAILLLEEGGSKVQIALEYFLEIEAFDKSIPGHITLPRGCPLYPQTLMNIGVCLYQQRKYSEALVKFLAAEEAIDFIMKRGKISRSKDKISIPPRLLPVCPILDCWLGVSPILDCWLAVTHYAMGRTAIALAKIEISLIAFENRFGPKSWLAKIAQEIFIHMGLKGIKLGLTKRLLKQQENNLDLQFAIEIHDDFLSQDGVDNTQHPSILTLQNFIASCLIIQGRHLKAVEILELIKPIVIQVHGGEHKETLSTKSQLAMALHEVGQVENAKILLEKVLTIRQKVLPRNHPDTEWTRKNLTSWTHTTGEREPWMHSSPLSKEIRGNLETCWCQWFF